MKILGFILIYIGIIFQTCVIFNIKNQAITNIQIANTKSISILKEQLLVKDIMIQNYSSFIEDFIVEEKPSWVYINNDWIFCEDNPDSSIINFSDTIVAITNCNFYQLYFGEEIK